ncbi:MAG: hypothetical protein GYB36_13480 [Alphaproteobacteria bacterium]|nr:hypothetical protein [Alphaproteobacteria bacterium]
MRAPLLPLALLCLTLGALAAPASAQIGDSGLPLDIEADHVDVLDAEKRIVWRGNVRANQGTSSLHAQRIEVFYTGTGEEDGSTGGWGDIERIEAYDEVLYITPAQRARGDQGVYRLAEETITLTGEVWITQGGNTIATNYFVTDLVSGDSSFGQQGDGERVRAVLIPEGDGEEPSN